MIYYSTIVPFVTGSCAIFFYVATKVYTHQALFVYAQPYEGGGKLMYVVCLFLTLSSTHIFDKPFPPSLHQVPIEQIYFHDYLYIHSQFLPTLAHQKDSI